MLEGKFAYAEPLRLALQNLALGRPGFFCTVNTTGAPVRIAAPGTLLLANNPVAVDGDIVELSADTTVWWTV